MNIPSSQASFTPFVTGANSVANSPAQIQTERNNSLDDNLARSENTLADDRVSLTQSSQNDLQDASGNQIPGQLAAGEVDETESPETAENETPEEDEGIASASEEGASSNTAQLTEEEQQLVQELAARDREVRAHEQAHKAVGGQYAGAISYETRTGPDGRQYAVGGEVPIDASPIPNDPQATIDKLSQVKAAALAPAEPSAQDQRVAASASQGITEARAELFSLQNEERLAAAESREEGVDRESSSQGSLNTEAVDTYRSVASLASSSNDEAFSFINDIA